MHLPPGHQPGRQQVRPRDPSSCHSRAVALCLPACHTLRPFNTVPQAVGTPKQLFHPHNYNFVTVINHDVSNSVFQWSYGGLGPQD